MRTCFVYNVKKNLNYQKKNNQIDIEFDSLDVIKTIENTIKKLGHSVLKIEADLNAYEKLKRNKDKIDLVFSIAEGLSGDARESQIPLFCEMLNIPYTHSSPTVHAIKLNKNLTKLLLRSVGVKSPKSFVLENLKQLSSMKLKYPLIVKPNKEGSSKGIFNDSVVKNIRGLKKAVNRLIKEFKCEVLIEEYIDGREFTVSMLGNPPMMLPIIEQKFDFLPKGFNKIAGYETKWIYEDNLANPQDAHDCPAKISKQLTRKIEKVSNLIWNTLNVKDCARIDYRLKGKNLYFLEINTLPGINPDPNGMSYFLISATKAGMTFEQVIEKIISSALERRQ